LNFREYIHTLTPFIVDEEVDLKYEVAALLKHYDGVPVYFSHYNLIGNIYSTPELFAHSVQLPNFSDWIHFFLKARYNFGKIIESSLSSPLQKISIHDLPILIHYEKDAGPYITSDALIATWDNHTNVSTHRILILNESELTLRIVHRHLYSMFMDAKAHGEDLPVAVCIGIPPSVQIAAATSLDPSENELLLAAALEGGYLHLFNGLPDSEIVIKGKILQDKVADEGPFVDITGKYDIIRKEPILEIEEIRAKSDFIYHALLPAGQDHQFLMGMPRIPMIYDAIRQQGVAVKDVYLSPEGFGWLKTIISIKKRDETDIKKVLEGTLSAHYSTKIIIVVDEDVNIRDEREVQRAITLNTWFDLHNPIVLTDVKGSSLDPRAKDDRGSKILIDATKPLSSQTSSFEQGKIPFDETKFKNLKMSRHKIGKKIND